MTCMACSPSVTQHYECRPVGSVPCPCICHMSWPPHPFLPHIDGRCWYCAEPAEDHAPIHLVAG